MRKKLEKQKISLLRTQMISKTLTANSRKRSASKKIISEEDFEPLDVTEPLKMNEFTSDRNMNIQHAVEEDLEPYLLSNTKETSNNVFEDITPPHVNKMTTGHPESPIERNSQLEFANASSYNQSLPDQAANLSINKSSMCLENMTEKRKEVTDIPETKLDEKFSPAELVTHSTENISLHAESCVSPSDQQSTSEANSESTAVWNAIVWNSTRVLGKRVSVPNTAPGAGKRTLSRQNGNTAGGTAMYKQSRSLSLPSSECIGGKNIFQSEYSFDVSRSHEPGVATKHLADKMNDDSALPVLVSTSNVNIITSTPYLPIVTIDDERDKAPRKTARKSTRPMRKKTVVNKPNPEYILKSIKTDSLSADNLLSTFECADIIVLNKEENRSTSQEVTSSSGRTSSYKKDHVSTPDVSAQSPGHSFKDNLPPEDYCFYNLYNTWLNQQSDFTSNRSNSPSTNTVVNTNAARKSTAASRPAAHSFANGTPYPGDKNVQKTNKKSTGRKTIRNKP